MPRSKKCQCCQRTSSTVTLFSFPEDQPGREAWAAFCGKHVQEIKKTHKVCSDHFEFKYFKVCVDGNRKMFLRPGAVPTLNKPTNDTVIKPKTCRGRKRKLEGIYYNKNETQTVQETVRKYKNQKPHTTQKKAYCCVCGPIYEAVQTKRFPCDPILRNQWMSILGITVESFKTWFRVCSSHFSDLPQSPTYMTTPIPSLIVSAELSSVHTENSSTQTKDLSAHTENSSVHIENLSVHTDNPLAHTGNSSAHTGNLSTTTENMNSVVASSTPTRTPSLRPRQLYRFGEFSTLDLQSPQRATKFFKIAKRTVHRYRTKIRTMNQTILRLQKRNNSLEDTIEEMRKRHLLTEEAVNTECLYRR